MAKKLYDHEHKEIALTKNERCFMKLLIDSSGYISSQTIEYSVWDETSMKQNCSNRLKALLNGLRKKLPKGSIINDYGFGYKLLRE